MPKFIIAVEMLEPEFKYRKSNLSQAAKIINSTDSVELGRAKMQKAKWLPLGICAAQFRFLNFYRSAFSTIKPRLISFLGTLLTLKGFLTALERTEESVHL